MKKKEELQNKKKSQEELAEQKFALLKVKAKSIGNYVHESVPVSNTEDNNALIRHWEPEGIDLKDFRRPLSHHEVLHRLDGYDAARGVKLVGHRLDLDANGCQAKALAHFYEEAIALQVLEYS